VPNPENGRYIHGEIDLLDLQNVDLDHLSRADVSAMAGEAAYQYIVRGIDLALSGATQAIVTGPIHKEALHQAGHHFPGHTEILAAQTGCDDFAMMLATRDLRVVLVTIHLALREAVNLITTDRVLRTIRQAHQAGRLLGFESPRIAVAGLNPHAGEGGLFGREEIEFIEPAVQAARAEGLDAQGPYPADTIFMRAVVRGDFDMVVPMYHDQGLIPIKLTGFGQGVNVTLGLPIIRTSVDHGTAFGKAWQFRADEGSLVMALELAARMARTKLSQGGKP
jgi:4-hydroxythreonine-4-phosphate dehydrogenase